MYSPARCESAESVAFNGDQFRVVRSHQDVPWGVKLEAGEMVKDTRDTIAQHTCRHEHDRLHLMFDFLVRHDDCKDYEISTSSLSWPGWQCVGTG